MVTIGQLIEMLSAYPKDMRVTTEQLEDFVHISNMDDIVVISTTKPIGHCNRSGHYVFPSIVKGYKAFSPVMNEDLFSMEFTPMKE